MKNIYNQLTTLGLSGIKEALMRQIEQPAHYQELDFEERLNLLLNSELMLRAERKITRLTRQAKFRGRAEIEQLDYRAQHNLNKAQIRSLAQGE